MTYPLAPLARWFGCRPNQSFRLKTNPKYRRLALEQLEVRDVPATFANWSITPEYDISYAGTNYATDPPQPFDLHEKGDTLGDYVPLGGAGKVEIEGSYTEDGATFTGSPSYDRYPFNGPSQQSATFKASFKIQGTVEVVASDDDESEDDPVDLIADALGQRLGSSHANFTINSMSYDFQPTTGGASDSQSRTIRVHIGDTITFEISGDTQYDEVVSQPNQGPSWGVANLSLRLEKITQDIAVVELTNSPDSQGIDYTYFVGGSPPLEKVPIGFYWSSSSHFSDAIGGPAFLTTFTDASDLTNDFHTKHLNWSQLTDRPENATYLLMVVDPNEQVEEADESALDNVMALQVSQAGGVKEVRAKIDDAIGPDNGYGTYISGVPLGPGNSVSKNFFTVTTEGTATKKVRFLIPGQGATRAVFVTKAVGTNGVTMFDLDPSKLVAGDYSITVTALNAAGQQIGNPYIRTLHVIDRLSFRLQADVQGTGMVDVSKLRLVGGVSKTTAPTLNMTATVDNLPLPSVYKDKLAVRFYNAATNAQQFMAPLSFTGATATFALPTSRFANSLGGTKFDYNAFLTALSAGLTTPKRLSDPAATSPHLFVLAKPSWLKEATYTTGDDIQHALGTGQAGYAFALSVPVINVKLPEPSIANGLFEGLTSSLKSDLNIALFAKLVAESTDDVKFDVENWNVNAILLGESVYSNTLSPADAGLNVTGSLNDPRLLSGVNSLTVATNGPVDLLGASTPSINWSFGKSGEKKKKWEISGNYGGVAARFHLAGSLTARLVVLDASASLTFKLANGGLVLDKPTSWLRLDTFADSTITLDAGVAVGLTIPIPLLHLDGTTIDIFDASLKGTITTDFEATFQVNLNNLTALNKQVSRAGIKVGYKFEYATQLLPGEPNSFVTFVDGTLGPIALFHLDLPDDMQLPA